MYLCLDLVVKLRLTPITVEFFCLFGGPLSNRIGLNWTLLLGAVGYPVYSYVVVLDRDPFGVLTSPAVLDFTQTIAMYARFKKLLVNEANSHREISGSF